MRSTKTSWQKSAGAKGYFFTGSSTCLLDLLRSDCRVRRHILPKEDRLLGRVKMQIDSWVLLECLRYSRKL